MREKFDEDGIYINYVGKWKVRKTDYGGGGDAKGKWYRKGRESIIKRECEKGGKRIREKSDENGNILKIM